jgi:hypothetical protein
MAMRVCVECNRLEWGEGCFEHVCYLCERAIRSKLRAERGAGTFRLFGSIVRQRSVRVFRDHAGQYALHADLSEPADGFEPILCVPLAGLTKAQAERVERHIRWINGGGNWTVTAAGDVVPVKAVPA